ncbi:MAG: hypothetical protein EXR71_01945 [Myxococcales bacterium]|nr:hypothetical protein [Myxococcales bacterium]
MTPPAEPHDPLRDTAPPGFRSGVLALLVRAVRAVPLGVADIVAWGVAYVWWWVVPIRRRVAVTNLGAALPTESPRSVLIHMMHDLVLGYIELLDTTRVAVVVEGAEGVRGAVMVAGHGGAWDLALLGLARSMPLTIFLRTPTDRWVQAFLAELRDTNHVHRLETGATMASAYAALATGRNVFFIQDQRHNRGPALPFFGRPARTSLGAAVAAAKAGAPIYGVWQWREGVGRHRVLIRPLAVSGDAEAVTTELNAFYAGQIAACPHGWLWLHNRWG